MASEGSPPPLTRTATDLRKGAFRDYAKSRFDDRSERKPTLPSSHRHVIEEEEKRISKIRERFKSKGDIRKLQLLENVAESRRKLITYLSEKAKDKNVNHRNSPLNEQEERSNEQGNEIKELVNELKVMVDEVEEPVYKTKQLVEKVKDLADKVNEPVDEFKAGLMYFKREEGARKWQGEQYIYEDAGSSSGDFPNQKIKMDAILSNTTKNRKLFKSDEKSIKYFHFPANHMEWIETAIERYYEVNKKDEKGGEYDDEDENQLLSFEYWRGQLHGAGIGKDMFHLRHMRPRCAVSDHTDHNTPSNIALFLPYLHWETNRRRNKMAQIVQELVEDKRAALNSHFVEAARQKAPCLRPKFNRKDIKNQVAGYLYDIAQVWDAMDYEADERLLRQSFSEIKSTTGSPGENLEPPLHIRRTLDQSYFSTVEDTTARDTDQVVYRQTRARKQNHHGEEKDGGNSTSGKATPQQSQRYQSSQDLNKSSTNSTRAGSTSASNMTLNKRKMTKLVGVTRVVMVDQLWMWILGEDTIITSFPRRWGRNKPDSSGIHKSLRKIIGKRKSIRSIYHLALIIIDQCSKVFFDRTQPTDDRPEVMDLFAEAIGTVAYHTTSAYSAFWANVSLHSSSMMKLKASGSSAEAFKYLNINPEGVLLKESQDIIEELNIMERLYKQQFAVVTELAKHMKKRHHRAHGEKNEANKRSEQPTNANITAIDLEEADDLTEKIKDRIAEISDLQHAVVRTNDQLQTLMSLKQQEASIVEARAALVLADESFEQGKAIMAFTIVTILFVPLGFFCGFFGMNNATSTGNEWMTLREQVMYMFVISAVIISSALFLAFRRKSLKPREKTTEKKMPSKTISLNEAIDRHRKEQKDEWKSYSQKVSRTTGRSENVTERPRSRKKANTSPV